MSMRMRFNITTDDIGYIINEVTRKLSLLNESVREGGKAGHMSNVTEVDTFTFGIYKQLVQDLFEVNIDKFTEKLDGMNIFATVSQDGSVRFARNMKDVRNEYGGMDQDGMRERWGKEGSDPTILQAYENAYKIFTDVAAKIKDPVRFFNGEGYRLYANCEVIDQVHPNVIPYPKVVLSFHGLAALSNDGTGSGVDLPDELYDQKMAVLEKLMPDVKSQYGTAQVTPQVIIKIKENCQAQIEKYISLLDAIEREAGVDDDTTIIQYRFKLLPKWLADNGYEILLDNPFTPYFIERWVYGKKDPSIASYKKVMRDSGVENWQEILMTAKEFEGDQTKNSPLRKALAEIMWPVDLFFYRLGNEVLSGVEGYANEGRETEVIDSYAEQLRQSQELVASLGDPLFQEEMASNLKKLSDLGHKYNALEGIVFSYRGHTLKLTGSFAALNQAINIKMRIGKKNKNQG